MEPFRGLAEASGTKRSFATVYTAANVRIFNGGSAGLRNASDIFYIFRKNYRSPSADSQRPPGPNGHLPPYIRRQIFGHSTEGLRGSGMPQIFFIYLEKIIGALPRTRRGLRDQTVICRRIYGGKSSVIQRRVRGAPECLRYFLYI